MLAAIYLGQITRWNDPAITALNPHLSLPPAAINVVHHSDGSGTTYIFSNYLSSIDAAWAAKVGTGKTLNWPAGEGAEGNPGVAVAAANGYVPLPPRFSNSPTPCSSTSPAPRDPPAELTSPPSRQQVPPE